MPISYDGYVRGNRLVAGSTQSGKTPAEVFEILGAAQCTDLDIAICVVDPHAKSLAWKSLQHLVAGSHTSRIIWDSLEELEHAPKYQFLRPSRATHSLVRAKENHQQAEQFTEVLCRRRDQQSLATAPLTEEWAMRAAQFVLNQPRDYPASEIRFALRPDHPKFRGLLSGCNDPDIRYEFERVASGAVRPSQYASALRLIDAVCGAPSFIARCGTSFDLSSFYDQAGILLIQGGNIGQQVMQTIMGSIILQTIHYIRTRRYPYPRVLLVLDEATNADLVRIHEVRALAECQKMGLDIHILVQSLNFPSSFITDGVLTNCIRHEWFYAANAAVARKAAEDLGDPELFNSIRSLGVAERYIKDRDSVYFEKVPRLESPHVLPELAELETLRAIEEIYQRDEYGGNDKWPLPSTGVNVTPQSSDGQCSISAQPGIISNSSPAKRLRIGGSRRSENGDS